MFFHESKDVFFFFEKSFFQILFLQIWPPPIQMHVYFRDLITAAQNLDLELWLVLMLTHRRKFSIELASIYACININTFFFSFICVVVLS